jgi:hypothetical protein
MGKGIDEVEIIFNNPIVVSSRQDEGLVTVSNFTHPKKAMEDSYPDGAFAYSQILSMDMNFRKPV